MFVLRSSRNSVFCQVRRIKMKSSRIQTSYSPEIFEKACRSFFFKYQDPANQPFLEYLETEWLGSNSGRYEGVRHLVPSTNNAVESINNDIKRDGTLCERLNLADFWATYKQIVMNWSMERNPFIVVWSRLRARLKKFLSARDVSVVGHRRQPRLSHHSIPDIAKGHKPHASTQN